MRLQTCQIFSQLLEAYLPEDSTAMGIIGSLDGGKEVVQKLHQNKSLAHDQIFSRIEKISWSDLKGNSLGRWVLIKGSKGAGAIRAVRDTYEGIAFNKESGQVETAIDGRGGNIVDFLKSKIGRLTDFYAGNPTGEVEKKRRDRRERNSPAASRVINKDTLVKKFKPLWIRAMTAAEADIKGMISTMIKNGAYEKAKKRISIAQSLTSAIDSMETGTLDDAPEFVGNAVHLAIIMAASHYYPDETGNIERHRYGGTYVSEFPQGPARVLADIAAGDQKKVGTILGFFKRNLISG
jgi:hypothetical protein